MALLSLNRHHRRMLLAYLALVACSAAVAAVKPSWTASLVAWYGLLIGGGFVELWWPSAGLAAHFFVAPWIGAFLKLLEAC